MKKCLYCAEEIQDEAIKCKHCGSMLDAAPKEKWYLKTQFLVIAFLCAGPFILPLIWLKPRLSQRAKIIVTALIVIVSYVLIVMISNSIKSIGSYYNMIKL